VGEEANVPLDLGDDALPGSRCEGDTAADTLGQPGEPGAFEIEVEIVERPHLAGPDLRQTPAARQDRRRAAGDLHDHFAEPLLAIVDEGEL
jgi:hypothetical protein